MDSSLILKWLFVTRESFDVSVPILKLAGFLLDRQQEVYVVSNGNLLGLPKNSNGIPLHNYPNFHHFELREHDNHGGSALKFAQNYFKWLAHYHPVVKAIQKGGVDIVIYYNPQLLPLIASNRRRGNTLVGYFSAELINPATQPHYLVSELLFARKADFTISCEMHRAAILKRRLMLRRMPFVLMNTLPDTNPLPDGSLRRKLGIVPSDLLILYQGHIDETRCSLELVSAVARLPDFVKCVLIGSAPHEDYKRKISHYIYSNDLSKRIFQLERIDYFELFKYTAEADVGCVFYRNTELNNYYCASNKLAEYSMCSLAIVGSDIPPLRSQLVKKKMGIVVNSESSESIYESLLSLISNRHEMLKMKARARDVFLRDYNYETLVSDLLGRIVGIYRSRPQNI